MLESRLIKGILRAGRINADFAPTCKWLAEYYQTSLVEQVYDVLDELLAIKIILPYPSLSFLINKSLMAAGVAFVTPRLIWLTLEAQASHTVALLASWERACDFTICESLTQARRNIAVRQRTDHRQNVYLKTRGKKIHYQDQCIHQVLVYLSAVYEQ